MVFLSRVCVCRFPFQPSVRSYSFVILAVLALRWFLEQVYLYSLSKVISGDVSGFPRSSSLVPKTCLQLRYITDQLSKFRSGKRLREHRLNRLKRLEQRLEREISQSLLQIPRSDFTLKKTNQKNRVLVPLVRAPPLPLAIEHTWWRIWVSNISSAGLRIEHYRSLQWISIEVVYLTLLISIFNGSQET